MNPSVTGQMMVDQGPRFESKGVFKKPRGLRSSNQVMGKQGIIRPDKRKKHKYL